MKDFLKLFETVMDFKGLSFLVNEQSLIKKWLPVCNLLPWLQVILVFTFFLIIRLRNVTAT